MGKRGARGVGQVVCAVLSLVAAVAIVISSTNAGTMRPHRTVSGTAGRDPVTEFVEGALPGPDWPEADAREEAAEKPAEVGQEGHEDPAQPDVPHAVPAEVPEEDRDAQEEQEEGPGVWSPTYRDEYGTDSAADDGSLTQWADGYFIAHDWSENGKAIASGQNVVIDGREYALAGSQTVSADTYYEDIEEWVHADGGIGMQTCTDGGYIVNRYVPVG